MSAVDQIINRILDREGGLYTDRPTDPGGPTKYGITLSTLSAWRKYQCSPLDVMNLARGEAYDIYLNKYYLAPGFGKVAALSQKIADELTDTGVNCGTAVATVILQRCLNAFNQRAQHYPDLKLDGECGMRTLSALAEYLARRQADHGEAVLLEALNCLQGERYIELAEKRADFEDYTFGWIRHRVLEVA